MKTATVPILVLLWVSCALPFARSSTTLHDLSSHNSSSCSKERTFACPNCNGIQVFNCLDECEGYSNTDVEEEICFQRTLFQTNPEYGSHEHHYPYLIRDIIGAILWFLTAGIATACGVGGGGIYVPLGILLLGFAPQPSSGLSQASIFGASLGGFCLNVFMVHPHSLKEGEEEEREEDGVVVYDRPLIDYDMALFLSPLEMAGAVLGVLIQSILPDWFFLSLAGVVLGLTSVKTYQKFWSTYAQEKEDRRRRVENLEEEEEGEEEGGDGDGIEEAGESIVEKKDGGMNLSFSLDENDEESAALSNEGSHSNTSCHTTNTNDGGGEGQHETETSHQPMSPLHEGTQVRNLEGEVTEDEGEDVELVEKRRELLKEDSRQYPTEKLLYLFLLWMGLAFITFLKGGKGVDSLIGITCQSPWFIVLVVAQFLWTLGFAFFFGLRLVKRQKERDAVRYPFHEKDVQWDWNKLRYYSIFTFFAGIIAGLIGIGGGMVLGPLMLVLGVHPRVSSATTATMIVLTSSSVAIMFVTSGLVPWEYALFFFCICISGAYIGKKYIDSYVKKSGMASILVGILATIIALSTIGCLVILFLDLKADNWCLDGFKKFCDVSVGEERCSVLEVLQKWNQDVSRIDTSTSQFFERKS